MGENDGVPHLPPVLNPPRDLTDEEYLATYSSGTGGHQLPDHVDEALFTHPGPEQEQ